MQTYAAKINTQVTGYTAGFLNKLEAYNWPGNIRELKNVIERAVILCDGNELDSSLLPYEFAIATAKVNTSSFDLAVIEQQHIHRVLAHTQGNRAEAARLLNIGITTLYRKLKEYGLDN